jgi:hypothetical protein
MAGGKHRYREIRRRNKTNVFKSTPHMFRERPRGRRGGGKERK